MEQLPKIVAQRLQAVSRAEAHPDANVLAAFAEKSLLEREQAQVMEHLAVCADCREVVAHAQPEEVLQQVAVAAAAVPMQRRSSWFSGAVIRWAAVAACVVVVGAVVISQARFEKAPVASNNEPAIVAKTEPKAETAPGAPAEDKNVLGASGRLKAGPDASRKRDLDQLAELDKERMTSTAAKGASEEQRQADQSLNNLEANNNSPAPTDNVTRSRTAAASPMVALPQEDAKSTKKEFSADKAMKAPATNEVVTQAQAVAPPPPPPAQTAKPSTTLADSQANRAESERVQSYYKQKDGYVGDAAGIGALAKMRAAVIPMWQLSGDGKLIKSTDHGQNWQPVPVDDKSVFQALCVTGNEIWLGGKQGTLFYSADAGQQWEQVKPMAKGQTLTADITTIEFKDLKHGKLTTADHQIWTTTDDGHSWKVETR